ncbi:MAG: diacylglycerol/lipid kinase family protein [Polyangiales bacterium]
MTEARLAIVNPAAGGGHCGKLAPAALARLQEAGLTVEQVHTAAPGDATRLAREAYARGVRHFVAVGGDGTAYEIVNGLLPEALGAAEAARPCLGFLPLGTGNSFLRDFTDRGAEHAIEALHSGRRRRCDVVHLEHDGGALYYINLLSAGFVAAVGATANRRFKRFGTAGYGLAVVVETMTLGARRYRMHLDHGPLWEQDALFLSFCNSRYTGGSMMMAPFADTADGQLDVIVARPMSRLALLAAFPRIFAGTHVHMPEIVASRASEVELDLQEAIDLMIDGEVEHHRPKRLRVIPGAIDVCV